MKSRKKNHGFSLIELVVTVSVAAILVTIALPGFQNLIVSNRLISQTNQLVTAIHYARNEAIRLNAPVTICSANSPDSTTCAGGAAGTDWLHWVVIAPGLAEPLLRSGSIDTRNNLNVRASSNISNNAIVFRADSLARQGSSNTPLNGALRICAAVSNPAQNARVIQIVNGGRLVSVPVTVGATGCTSVVSNS